MGYATETRTMALRVQNTFLLSINGELDLKRQHFFKASAQNILDWVCETKATN